MKRSTKYKLSSLISLGLILLGFNQCVSPIGGKQKNSLKFSDGSSTSNSVEGSGDAPDSTFNGTLNPALAAARAVSLEAFRKTVYSVTKARCISCHETAQTPLHASNNINVAFDAVINSSKIDFATPANSRLVLKLRNEKHNCWGNCESNADEMLAQINTWKNLTAGTIADAGNTSVSGKTSRETIIISDALNPFDFASPGNVMLMAEASSLKAPMINAVEDIISYVWTPTTAGIKDLTSVNAGTATLNFSVKANAPYNIYMYVNAPSASSDSVYVKAAGSNYKEWTIDTTVGFQWRRLTETPQKLPTSFSLTAGTNYLLEIRQKEPGVKISKVLVTDYDYDISGMAKMKLKATLTVSLSDITGVADTFMDIDVEEFDLYSYKLSNPRIRTPKALKVKKLKILMNGNFNPQHSTYLVVDKTVTKTDPILSPAVMILLKDKGAEFDKLSFSFDIIEESK